ncbi:MAG: bifunctional riboflavin kinase/FAD synthetase [Deltaproteobacteria bacterium]|nr:bifunctional riboflavin kinase/FAD synthetase [Deltaproteobacteria bacterium]
MQVFRSAKGLRGMLAGPAVAIGNFDGVHLGHQALMRRAKELAHAHGGSGVALTFDPHPARYFKPDLAPPLITSLDQRLELLAAQGLDAVVVEPFGEALASLAPDAFVEEVLVRGLGAQHVVVGESFVFGHRRGGSLATLTELGHRHGFTTVGLPAVCAQEIVVSSTKIREFVLMGRMEGATLLLGRDHFVDGVVVTGQGRGRTIGVPTANLASENELVPGRGVYAARATLASGDEREAVVNIGTAPTFGGSPLATVEAHLLDFEGELVGQRLRLHFAHRLRDERKFPSAGALVEAIRADIATARSYFAGRPR